MIKRVMIAAPKSGSGKTSVTLALLSLLKKQQKNTVSFKCGPDYIDPLFHKRVLGIDSFNLDTFFTDEETTVSLFDEDSNEFDYAVIEGVMGLYDGLGGIREEGSSYHLASVLKTPIILVVDAKGMGKSVTALIKGYQDCDKDNLIKGVILNRVSSSFFKIIAPIIEEENKISVLGFIPENKDINISSRHLGLVIPNDITDINRVIEKLSEEFEANVSFDKLQNIFDDSANVSYKKELLDTKNNNITINEKRDCTIAVAKDDAFCFLYEDNLKLLKKYGAAIKYFSPLKDKSIPEDADALLLPGGYPELHLEELSNNKSMMESIKEVYDRNMPIVAECGGFMYLHNSITDKDGKQYNTVGVIDADCTYTGKSVRFGYIEVSEKNPSFLNTGECIKGHEFHYYDSTYNGESCTAKKPVTGKEYDCIINDDCHWMGFPHLYYPSNPSFAENFVKKACEYRRSKR